jgi:hypothetical protein
VATIEPSEAFVCGLLHDIGKVALDAALPKSFGRVVEAVDLLRGNIADVERTVVGLDHMVVGKRLAERWQLPANARDCIWLHGQLPQALPATVRNPRLVNLITLSDVLVREQHLGYSGNYTFTYATQNLIEAFGPALKDADEIVLTDIYAAGEDAIPGVTIEGLAESIRRGSGRPVVVTRQLDELVTGLVAMAKPGDAIITLGAGSIGTVPRRLIEALGHRGAPIGEQTAEGIAGRRGVVVLEVEQIQPVDQPVRQHGAEQGARQLEHGSQSETDHAGPGHPDPAARTAELRVRHPEQQRLRQ